MPQAPDNSPLRQDVRTEAAFARFVRETQSRLRAFLHSKGLRPQDADDIAQEAYLTVWKRRAEARNPRSFLLGIASRLVQAHHRKSIRLDMVSLDEGSWDAASPPPRLDAAGPATDLEPVVVCGLDRLSRRQREVLELVWLQDRPRPAAAEDLGISQGTLRAREKRALDALRELAREQRGRTRAGGAPSAATEVAAEDG